jgi:uncharacterized membrane protein YbhN (UPF0104 family)
MAAEASGKGWIREGLKLLATVIVLVLMFLEVGGGWQRVDAAALCDASALATANPDYPGLIGRLRAKVSGQQLPPATVPVSRESVCAPTDATRFVTLADGRVKPLRTWHHCHSGQLDVVRDAAGATHPLTCPATGEAWVRVQGFQLVPMDLVELWTEVRSLEPTIFAPWMIAALLIKLVGILANVFRWQILLRGQGIHIGFGYLSSSYFVGRYFGIVTPGTLGLDGYRLYDTIRLTRKPVECTTAIAIERVIGAVGLLATIVLFMPFAGDLTQGQSLGALVRAIQIPLVFAMIFSALLVMQPTWFRPVVNLAPKRVRAIASNAIDAATAYHGRRSYLLIALCMAVVGQVTTTLMYFCNAMAIHTVNVRPMEVLFASAVMTLGTFLAPSASGEGVREVVFVWLLGSKAGAAKSFLIGHLGFWIEKVPLSLPGAAFLFVSPDARGRVTQADLERVRNEASDDQAP